MKKSTTTPLRYSVRYITEEVQDGESRWLVQTGWGLYDWGKKETMRTFAISEEEQAEGLCKLLNSIEEENDGLSK